MKASWEVNIPGHDGPSEPTDCSGPSNTTHVDKVFCIYIHYNTVSVDYNIVSAMILLHVICCSWVSLRNMLLMGFSLAVTCGSSKAQFTRLRFLSFYYTPSFPRLLLFLSFTPNHLKQLAFPCWVLVSEEVVLPSPPLPGANASRAGRAPPVTGTPLDSQAICSQEMLGY